MSKFQKYVDVGFLASLLLIPFLPPFGRIDIIGPQYLYLSIIFVFYLFLKSFSIGELEFKFNHSTKFYSLFLLISLLSFTKSINLSESIIDFSKYVITFFILVVTYTIYHDNKIWIKNSLFIILMFLSIETTYIMYLFIENYSFDSPPDRLRIFQGFAYNQNVASLSILAKIPLTLYFYLISKNKTYKIGLALLLWISVFDILILGTRSAIYGLYLYLIFISCLYFIKIKFGCELKKKSISSLILIISSVFLVQTILYTNSEKLKVADRSVAISDYSTNYRLNLWKASIEMLKDNPFLGLGIGNWKIESINYSKDYITQYEVPKHAHNDFLQIIAETGFFGGIFFLTFLISPFYLTIKNFNKINYNNKLLAFFLLFTLISIYIDSFFNFPRVRPYSLLNLFWAFAITYTINSFEKKQ